MRVQPGALVGRRLLAILVPAGLFASLSLVLSWPKALIAPVPFAVVALGPPLVVACMVAWRAWVAERDLARVAACLRTSPLADLPSIRPTTAEGRTVTRAVSDLLEQGGRAARVEDVVQGRVETAQHLRVNFVASMGHDLRAPLNSMLGFADLLLLDDDGLSQVQRDSLQRIRQRTLDLLMLIDDMLDWARLEAGRLTLERRPVGLAQVVESAIALATSRAAGRPFAVAVTALPADAVIQVDPAHFQHALVALMGDAIRGGHGESLRLEARVGVSRGGGPRPVEVSVVDPGLIVREEDQQRLLEAFRPSYAPSGQRIAGIGLGLACARALVRAHGGELNASGHGSGGTEFRLVFEG